MPNVILIGWIQKIIDLYIFSIKMSCKLNFIRKLSLSKYALHTKFNLFSHFLGANWFQTSKYTDSEQFL